MTVRLSELAELSGAELRGDPERAVRAVRALDRAEADDLSFVLDRSYREQARRSHAGALLVPPALADLGGGGSSEGGPEGGPDLLVADDPGRALVAVLARFDPTPSPRSGVHSSAVVGAGVEIDPSASVGPYAVIGDGAAIGPGAAVGAHAVIGRGCRLGAGAVLHPHAVLYDRTEIGARSIVHAGAVLGADGFGYSHVAGVHLKRPHLGRTVIGDDVEIGANSAVDRGMVEETRVGDGSKIDNLVQVGHNATVGRGCILCGQVGIAGTATLGDGVVMGGQSGAGDHVELGAGVQVAGKSAVLQSVAAGKVGGIPAVELGAWKRSWALLGRLGEVLRRLRAVERAQARIERRSTTEDGR